MRTYSTKKLDLIGRRFGKLTVTEAADAKGGHTAWLCRCDCGNPELLGSHVGWYDGGF